MTFRRDEFGIPVLNGGDIENLAGRFLGHVAPGVLRVAAFTPLAEVMTILRDEGWCTFAFDEDLGRTPEGYKYLGYYHLKRRHISIDKSLDPNSPRFAFTVAHELGHFYLHGSIKAEALGLGSEGIRDSTRDLVTHRIEGSNPRSLLEWQANRFAAGILVPQTTVGLAVMDIQRALGISRLGVIWLDRQRDNQRTYRTILERLSETYRVSRAVIRYRLSELGLLHEDRTGQPMRVADVMSEALAELFHGI